MDGVDTSKKSRLVSIIIPAYNVERYVREAVDSALAQTYPNVEVIVMDDGSRDGTRAVLEPYIKNGTIAYYFQENRGLSAARNAAIKKSNGEFITLLDADDMFLPTKVERQVAYLMEYPACDICYCDYWCFYDGEPGRFYRPERVYYSGDAVFPYILKQNVIGCIAMMFRRSVFERIGYFNEEIVQYVEDWDFTLRAAYRGLRFDFMPEAALSHYRIRRDSLSHDPSLEMKRKRTIVRVFEGLARSMKPEDRERYHMGRVLFFHRSKLWYAELARFLPPFRWYQMRRQENTFKEVTGVANNV